ncbi:MAG TPA: DNA-binding protein [Thermoanaerobaculia bacterium]|nr:DNA-binding protein [Thermoanaerobaculia bacterium]
MAETEPRLSGVVCDAGPLLHLDELGCSDLLEDLRPVLVPQAVWAEVERLRPQALTPVLEEVSHAVALPAEIEAVLRGLSLHEGERQALRWIAANPTLTLLTDDAAARLAAKALGWRVHGTVGILLRAARRGQREPSAILEILRAIPHRSTLHIKPSLLSEIIAEAARSWQLA